MGWLKDFRLLRDIRQPVGTLRLLLGDHLVDNGGAYKAMGSHVAPTRPSYWGLPVPLGTLGPLLGDHLADNGSAFKLMRSHDAHGFDEWLQLQPLGVHCSVQILCEMDLLKANEFMGSHVAPTRPSQWWSLAPESAVLCCFAPWWTTLG